MSLKLSRTKFWQLHHRVFIACYGHDFITAYRINPTFSSLYGFNKGKDNPRSIRRIIEKEGHIKKINTRLLHELRKQYDDGADTLEISKYLLYPLLGFLKINKSELEVKEDPPREILISNRYKREISYSTEYEVRFKDFCTSEWYLYNKDFDQNKEEKVFRSVLKIKNETLGNDGNLEVELKTPGGDQYSDFEGQIIKKYSTSNVLHIRLNTTIARTSRPLKFRYIVLRIEPKGKNDKSKELYMGQYLRFDSNYIISTYTVIAHRQSEKMGRVYPDILNRINKITDIENAILAYFNSSPSRLTIPSNVFSPNDFRREMDKRPKAYDLYISAPVTDLFQNEKQLQELYSEIDEMKKSEILASLGIINIFSKDKNKLSTRTTSDKQLQKELEAIKNAKLCLFIYPVKKIIHSSIDVLLGAALCLEKPTFILHKGTKYLPRIARSKTNNLELLNPSEKIAHFPEWLRDNLNP